MRSRREHEWVSEGENLKRIASNEKMKQQMNGKKWVKSNVSANICIKQLVIVWINLALICFGDCYRTAHTSDERRPDAEWRMNWLAVANALELLIRGLASAHTIVVYILIAISRAVSEGMVGEWKGNCEHEWGPTYRSSKNINFISISARNMNIFWLSFISVTDDDGNECPTATKPKFCTQLWPSP